MSRKKTSYPSSFGERLRFFRKAKGMTQAHLAGFIGVASDTLSRYERGELTPSIEVVVKIVNALAPDVSVDDLLFSSTETKSPYKIDSFGLATGLTFYDGQGAVTVSMGMVEISRLMNHLKEVVADNEIAHKHITESIKTIMFYVYEEGFDEDIEIEANVPIGTNAIKFQSALSKKKDR